MEKFVIEFVKFFGPDNAVVPYTDGYYANDYLPDFDDMEFGSEAEAHEWIMENHKGPDVDGIDALFAVVTK